VTVLDGPPRPDATDALAQGARVALWRLENSHIPALHAMIMPAATRATWRTRGFLWSPAELQARLTAEIFTSAVVTRADDPADVIGLAELSDADFLDGRAQLSLVMAERTRGGPLGAEAALLFVRHCFDAYPLDKLSIMVQGDNDRLAPGLRRLLSHEGCLRRHLRIDGRWIDVDLFALWRHDLERLERRLGGVRTWEDR
jgi:RimJ/RimL family protein N-acetyltransferase